MTDAPKTPAKTPRWPGPVIFLLTTALIVVLGLLATSIMERRWETLRPQLVVTPLKDWEPDNAVWGRNYPREFETYSRTAEDTSRTRYGGSFPRDYLEERPNLVILFAGYAFSKEYRQARGHYHAVEDVTNTHRIKPQNPATCWTCKSTDVPRVMYQRGVEALGDKAAKMRSADVIAAGAPAFYAAEFHTLSGQITHPIGCQDCHDPETMNLRITRPALREAMAAGGMDADKATHQQMRSLVCAQCHVEYYFKTDAAAGKKDYLTFPWSADAPGRSGTSVEAMIDYYEARDFADWVHPISKTRILKAQHPDYEFWTTGIHARSGVSCADCHMPYRTEGGMKFTDHHVQSPLLNIANSCNVCHRRSEAETVAIVQGIQDTVAAARSQTEAALVKAHFDVAAALQSGATDDQLVPVRKLLRHAQFRWDYVAANNGMGFHSPKEALRILGDARDQAQQVRLMAARLLAAKGIASEPLYPDVSTRQKAWAVAETFVNGKDMPNLISR